MKKKRRIKFKKLWRKKNQHKHIDLSSINKIKNEPLGQLIDRVKGI